ncbi:MAG: winged helix-turn-helix domain-containing protein [Armatimonadota bacterium]
MIDEANLLCDRIERLIGDAQSLMNSDSKSEKLGQLKEVRTTIDRLSKKGLNVPELLVQLQENLAEDEKAVSAAANTLEVLSGRIVSIAEKLKVSPSAVQAKRFEKKTDIAITVSGSGVTSPKVYEQPIIDALRQLGGSAPAKEVRKILLETMGDQLTEADLEVNEKYREVVWWNRARWARQALVTRGILRSNSPNGIWELADDTHADND